MYLYIYTLTYTYIYSDFGAKEKQCIQIKAGNLLRDLTELFLTDRICRIYGKQTQATTSLSHSTTKEWIAYRN